MLRNGKKLTGFHLGAIDGEIGSVKGFYFDDVSWTIRYLVADTGHWLPLRKVLISPHAIGDVEDGRRVVRVKLTREQIERSPSTEEDKPVSRQFEEEYLTHFGWPIYWQNAGLWGAGTATAVPPIAPTDTALTEKSDHVDPHLRDTSEVTGYHLQANDGEIGHVEDFVIDDRDWKIRYLVVGTRNWWPGKKVLISPLWITKVSWPDAKVFVDLKRDQISRGPEYHPDQTVIDREFEAKLREACGKPVERT